MGEDRTTKQPEREADAFDGQSTVRLLDLVKDGDQVAMNRLYERSLLPLRRWASGRIPSWARGGLDTDDLVQETVFKSLRRLHQFHPERTGDFNAYLRQGVRNRIRDELRRLHRHPWRDPLSSAQQDPGPSPIEEAIGKETLELYERALAALKPAEREAIVARVELRLSYKEVAQALDKPSADAARMAVARAMVRLADGMAHGR